MKLRNVLLGAFSLALVLAGCRGQAEAALAPASPTPQPATCIATSAADSGPGTVRACFQQANTSPGQSWIIKAPSALITQASPLPIVPGQQIDLECVAPVILATGSSIMDNWQFAYGSGGSYAGITTGLGTVFQGSGFEAISGNTTPLSSGAATFTNWLTNVHIHHCGFNGFTNAIHFGATNSQGMGGGEISDNYFINFTNAAIVDENMAQASFSHNRIKVTVTGASGEIHEADELLSGYQPGNFHLDDEFVTGAAPARGYGYLFTATPGSILSVGAGIGRIQANGTTTPVNLTLTPAASSTAVAVADLTKLFVGQVLHNTTTASGYTTGFKYVVQTVSGSTGAGTVTIGFCQYGVSTNCPPITATASTALTMTWNGQPSIAAVGQGTGLVSQLDLSSLDLENGATNNTSIYTEHTVNSWFQAASQEGCIVLRNGSTFNHFLSSANNACYDADNSSAINVAPEYRGVIPGAQGFGIAYDNVVGAPCIDLNYTHGGSNLVHDVCMSFYSAGAHWAFNTPFGQATVTGPGGSCSTSAGSPTSLSGYNGLFYVGFPGPGCFYALPTITSTAGHDGRGDPMWIINYSIYPVTIETDGTQLINPSNGTTSIVIAPGQAVHLQSTNGTGSGSLAYAWEAELPGSLMVTAAGVYQGGGHTVNGTGALASGTATITLTGGAPFTSATSVFCAANDNTTPANAVTCTKNSGSSFTFAGTGADGFTYSLTGN